MALFNKAILPLVFFIALVLSSIWVRGGGIEEETSVSRALSLLDRAPTGHLLLERAKKQFGEHELASIFKWGDTSRTDATLTRQLDPKTGQEKKIRAIAVYLRRDQPLESIVLDMAHELTHAMAGPKWDPYDPGLTAGQYIWAAIEAEGGEADALLNECQVERELRTIYSKAATSDAHCSAYEGVSVSRAEILRDFYSVGSSRQEVLRRLGAEASRFPLLSSRTPRLYSSTGNAPYPVALIEEFDQLTQAACQNSRARLGQLGRRSPASVRGAESDASRFLARRCQGM